MTHRNRDANWKNEQDHHRCECCSAKMGARLDRGCTWSWRFQSWFDACSLCKDYIRQDNRDLRHKAFREPMERVDDRWLRLVGVSA
jgi:hypothetical protein